MSCAASHLSWLLTRGYAETSALKLVGDRFRLEARQRLAVRRAACSKQAWASRKQRQLPLSELAGQPVSVDGFNLLTTVEAAMAGGVLLDCQDGCLRDMASMHGSYRSVEETLPALQAVGRVLHDSNPRQVTWWLDRPVSNSGRLGESIRQLAAAQCWTWQVRIVPDPDFELRRTGDIVVSADSVILDSCQRWANLAPEVVRQVCPEARLIPFHEFEAESMA